VCKYFALPLDAKCTLLDLAAKLGTTELVLHILAMNPRASSTMGQTATKPPPP
jgi:hypothetical protein